MKAIMNYIELQAKTHTPQARLVYLKALKAYIDTLETDALSQITREELAELTQYDPIKDFERIKAIAERNMRYYRGIP